MGASVRPDDLDALIAARRKALASPGDDLDALIASRRAAQAPSAPAPTPPSLTIASESTGALPRNRPNVSGDLEAATRSPGEQLRFIGEGLASNVANAAQGIPGAEVAQAGVRSLVRNQPYREALSDIRSATASIPAAVRVAERLAGALPLAASVPVRGVLSAAKTGAILGGADRVLAADPDMDMRARIVQGAEGAGAGAVLGGATAAGGKLLSKTLDLANKARRIRAADPLDVDAVKQTASMRATDQQNYGQAAVEGQAAGGTSPELQAALEHRRVKPFVEMFRDSERGQNADDATAARETYKLMTRQWKGLQAKLKRDGYDAKIALEIENLKAGQEALKQATAAPNGPVMPSFPAAVDAHAEAEGERQAFNAAADATTRIMNNRSIAARNLDRSGAEQFRQSIARMSPSEAEAALRGTLGRAKDAAPKAPTRVDTFWGSTTGLVQPALKLNRIAPIIDLLDKQAGRNVKAPLEWQRFLRALVAANATQTSP